MILSQKPHPANYVNEYLIPSDSSLYQMQHVLDLNPRALLESLPTFKYGKACHVLLLRLDMSTG